jgi:hypothetical protein
MRSLIRLQGVLGLPSGSTSAPTSRMGLRFLATPQATTAVRLYCCGSCSNGGGCGDATAMYCWQIGSTVGMTCSTMQRGYQTDSGSCWVLDVWRVSSNAYNQQQKLCGAHTLCS